MQWKKNYIKMLMAMYACLCGAQQEVPEPSCEPIDCWRCDDKMKKWRTRDAKWYSLVMDGAKADQRNESGGY